MDQNPMQAAPVSPEPVVQPAVAPTTDIVKLKKRVRNAGWVTVCIGYLYLLSAIVGILSLIYSVNRFASLENVAGANQLKGLATISLSLAIPGLISSILVGVTLIALGKRIIRIRKGLVWNPGDVIADPNIKQYFFYLIILFGFQLLTEIVSSLTSELDIISTIFAFALFAYALSGFVSSKKLLAMPEFLSGSQAPVYKRTPKFWLGMIIAVIVLAFVPVAMQGVLRDKIDNINSSLPAQTENVELPTAN